MEEKKCQDGGMRSSRARIFRRSKEISTVHTNELPRKSETKNPKEFRDWKARWAEWLFLVLQSQTFSLFLFSFRVDVKIFHFGVVSGHSTGFRSLSHNPDIEGSGENYSRALSNWVNICLTELTRSFFQRDLRREARACEWCEERWFEDEQALFGRLRLSQGWKICLEYFWSFASSRRNDLFLLTSWSLWRHEASKLLSIHQAWTLQ